MGVGEWLFLFGFLALGAHGVRAFVGEVRERAELDDATRQKEREDLVLAVDALASIVRPAA